MTFETIQQHLLWDIAGIIFCPMAKLRLIIYGLTAIGGIVWPWYCIYQFIQETEALGLTDPLAIVELFSKGVWANASAGFIAADLTLVLIAAFAFFIAEGTRLRMKFWYLYFAATFAISFAFSFGLFMLNRERNIINSTNKEI